VPGAGLYAAKEEERWGEVDVGNSGSKATRHSFQNMQPALESSLVLLSLTKMTHQYNLQTHSISFPHILLLPPTSIPSEKPQ